MTERRVRSMEERFWAKVNKDGPVPTGHPEYEGLGPCWVYNEGKANSSVAFPRSHRLDGPKRVLAWRYSYELANGPIQTGLILRHRCDNGKPPVLCVNPAHLVAGTFAENSADTSRRRLVPFRRITPGMAAAMIETRERYGVTAELLAAIANVELANVHSALYDGREGVEPTTRRFKSSLSDDDVDRLRSLLADGLTLRKAAVAIGRDWKTCEAVLVAAGTPYARRPFLTAEQLDEARRLAAEGKSVNAIADALGRSWPQTRKTLAAAGIEPVKFGTEKPSYFGSEAHIATTRTAVEAHRRSAAARRSTGRPSGGV